MPEKDENRIRRWNDGMVAGRVQLRLILTSDPRSRQFSEYTQWFLRVARNIALDVQNVEAGLPCIRIGSAVQYHLLPAGVELAPFLEAIRLFGEGIAAPSPGTQRNGKNKTFPSSLKVFVTPHCPHCPAMLRRLFPLLGSSDGLQLTVIDGMLFPEKAAEHDIRSVPTLILDKDYRWSGDVALDELAEFILHRDPARMGAKTLENLLKDGKAGPLAEMMLGEGKIFPAFYVLLFHDKWPVRLGAMVAMEEIAHKDPPLAKSAVDAIISHFPSATQPVQGDMIYLLGRMAGAHNKILPFLRKVLNHTLDPELREAAQEAMDAVKENDG